MPPSKSIEIQTQKAIDAYRHAEKPKITQIAREFNVPYPRLRRRLHIACLDNPLLDVLSSCKQSI